MIRAAIFDMDGVLCEFSDDRRIGYLHKLTQRGHEELRDAIWTSGFETQSDKGHFSTEEYLAGFGERIGHPITRSQWIQFRSCGMTPDLNVLKLARMLSIEVRVAVLTNNGPLLKETIHQMFPELFPIFGMDVFVSSEFKTSKPDPDIYKLLCSRLKVSPSDTLMIDDRAENIEGAVNAGLHGIHFVDHIVLKEQLIEKGLL